MATLASVTERVIKEFTRNAGELLLECCRTRQQCRRAGLPGATAHEVVRFKAFWTACLRVPLASRSCSQRVVSRWSCSARAGSRRICHSAWLARVEVLAFWLEVEGRPEFHQPVQAVEAEGVLVPAGAEGGGEVAVAGAVDLLDPGAQPVEGLVAFGSVEFPPSRRGRQLVGLAAHRHGSRLLSSG